MIPDPEDFLTKAVLKVISDAANLPMGKIDEQSHLEKDLNMDETAQMTLILSLESELNTSIKDQEAEGMKTVGDILRILKNPQRERGPKNANA